MSRDEGQTPPVDGGGPGYIQEPMAIVGMACKFPGDADSPSKLWEMLEGGRSAQGKIPAERFNVDSFYHKNIKRPGSICTDSGYFIRDNPRAFDPAFFGIRPAEAKVMDPQHRKLLEVTYECIESAGLVLGDLRGSDTGVYMAGMAKDFQEIQLHDVEYSSDYKWVGSTSALLSNRISYAFDLHGPSLSVDTACSGGMHALHAACCAIQGGECSSAFVGGSNLILSPEQMLEASKGGVLSPTGTCRTFDDSADGYGRADGVAVLYIKRLADAFENNDPVVAVVRSTATSANGRTSGIVHPSREGQRCTIEACYRRGGHLDPLETAYVECHGTGTRVGDPIEVSALADVFSPGRPRDQPLLISSVKSNIGHSEPTSAIAGIIKTALALKNGLIPATAGLRNPSRKIEWEAWNVCAVKQNTPWPKMPVRRASVNSFGYGGANSHTVMEAFSPELVLHALHLRHHGGRAGTQQYIQAVMKAARMVHPKIERFLPNGHESSEDKTLYLVCISAHEPAAARRYAHALSSMSTLPPLKDLSYTLGSRRTHFLYRGAVVVSGSSFQEELKTVVIAKKMKDKPSIAFVFTGQGAQWPAMGRSLIAQFPIFRNTVKSLDDTLSLLEQPPSWRLMDMLCSSSAPIDEPEFSQPLNTALQIALVDLLRNWNISPLATIGHSSGELAAAFASGRLTSKEAITLAYYRGLAAKRVPATGAMLAVQMNAELAESYLPVSGSQLVDIACINSPESITLSGDEPEIAKIQALLDSQGIFNRRLRTGNRAYHSRQMRAVGQWYFEKYRDVVQGYEGTEETLKVIMVSSVTGKLVSTPRLDDTYWKMNMESPVMFTQSMEELLQLSDVHVDTIIEIGPHSALGGPISQIRSAKGFDTANLDYMSAAKRGVDPVATVLKVAGSLYQKGYPVDLMNVNRITEVSGVLNAKVVADLPRYQWASETYWTENRHSYEFRYRKHPRHDLLGGLLPGLSQHLRIWRNLLRLRHLPWLKDHKVAGEVVFPAAGYIAMAVEALSQTAKDAGFYPQNNSTACYVLEHFKVKDALQFPESAGDSGVEILLEMRPVDWSDIARSKAAFEFKIATIGNGQWTEHASGTIRLKSDVLIVNDEIALSAGWKSIKPERAYEKIRKLGLEYGPTFNRLSDIRVRPQGSGEPARAQASALLGSTDPGESDYAVHPASIDACLQLALAAQPDEAGFPIAAEKLVVWQRSGLEKSDSAKVQSTKTPIGMRSVSIDANMRTSDGKPLLEIQGFRCVAADIKDKSSVPTPSKPYCRLVRKPFAEPQLQSTDETIGYFHVNIVLRDQETELGQVLRDMVLQHDNCCKVYMLRDLKGLGRGVTVLLADLERPMLSDMDSEELRGLQHLTRNSERILWVTSSIFGHIPFNAMSVGFARVVRDEVPEVPVYTLEFETEMAVEKTAKSIWNHLAYVQAGKAEPDTIDIAGVSYIERLAPDESLIEGAEPENCLVNFHEHEALRICIGDVGRPDTIFFTNDEEHLLPLAPDEVEIRVKAAGMSEKNIASMMGQVDEDSSLIEATGFVTNVGSNVSHLGVGDRVLCLGQGYYGTYMRTNALLCSKLDDDETFTDMAIMPLAFCTALHCLDELARLKKNETVLICLTSDGAGLAAIQVAKSLGAEIYVAVFLREQVRDEYGIPNDHILDASSGHFSTSLTAATKGRGVDVILNLGNYLQGEISSHLARFGREVVVEAHGVNQKRPMQTFDRSKSVIFFSFNDLVMHRPERVQAHLQTTLFLYRSKAISSIKPTKAFDVSETAQALAYLTQAGDRDAAVITYDSNEGLINYRAQTKCLKLKGDATYLIVGGLGGLGRSLAYRMYERGARGFLFLSRSGTDKPEAKQLVESLENIGARVGIVKGDVSKREDVDRAISSVSSLHPIKGVINAAMVLKDQFLENLTVESLRAVIGPKVQGSINIHHALQNHRLDFFVMTSSLTGGIVALLGQSSYGASNAFLDAFARYRLSQGLPAISVNLGMISEIGVVGEDESLKSYLSRLGLYSQSEEEYLSAMELAMLLCPQGDQEASSSVQLMEQSQLVLGFEAARIIKQSQGGSQRLKFPWQRYPRLSVIANTVQTVTNGGSQERAATSECLGDLIKQTRATSGEEAARAVLREELMQNLAHMLSVDITELEDSKGFSNYGLDSMLAAELRGWVFKEFGANVTLLQLLKPGFTFQILENMTWEKVAST